jgi:hypothetical protein
MEVDVKKAMEFADWICEDANGDVTKMNRLAANRALAFYLNNVTNRGAVSRHTFANSYPDMLMEIEEIRLATLKQAENEVKQTEQGDRITALEEKFDTMLSMLTKLTEAEETDESEDGEPEPEPKPRKRRTRKSKAQDADEGAEETDSEADADESDDDTESES